MFLFDLILYIPVNNIQLWRDKSRRVETVLSKDTRINVSCSRIKHSDASEARTPGPSVLAVIKMHLAT